MSRRTAAASRAVRDAWAREQELILEGKGTRDWSPEQQQSIIDNGKAYDDNGRAVEGHHMKSVEANPDYQSDAGNIQFLTRSEHKDAHGGHFGNPTNGYYDYITGMTKDFGAGPYEPCVVIELSEPVALPVVSSMAVQGSSNVDVDASSSKRIELDRVKAACGFETQQETMLEASSGSTNGILARVLRRGNSIAQACKSAWPGLKEIYGPEVIRWAIGTSIVAGVGLLSERLSSGGRGSSIRQSGRLSDVTSSRNASKGANVDADAWPGVSNDDSVALHFDGRASPIEHTVRSYERIQHTNEGDKIITVPSYTRGGRR